MLSLRLDGDLAAQLRDLASQRGVSVSDLLREAAGALVEGYKRRTVIVSVRTSEAQTRDYTPDISTRSEVTYWDAGAKEAHHSGNAGSPTSGRVIQYA
jgi:hypothetical protein